MTADPSTDDDLVRDLRLCDTQRMDGGWRPPPDIWLRAADRIDALTAAHRTVSEWNDELEAEVERLRAELKDANNRAERWKGQAWQR